MNLPTTAETAASTCPPGCAGHLGGDVHISVERVVRAPGATPAVRLQGAMDTPMSPAQALQLAAVLTAQAFTAVTSWQAQR